MTRFKNQTSATRLGLLQRNGRKRLLQFFALQKQRNGETEKQKKTKEFSDQKQPSATSLLQRNKRWRLLAAPAAVSCLQYFALQKQRGRNRETEEFSDWSQPSATQGCYKATDCTAAVTFCTAVNRKGSAMLYKLHQAVSAS